ncbi:MAG: hypothetical protein ABI986_14065 [Chloroflexota bacterium]
MNFKPKTKALFPILLVVVIAGVGCMTISPAAPTLTRSTSTQLPGSSPTTVISAVRDKAAPSTEIATSTIQAIISTIARSRIAEHPSPDRKWSVAVDRYECSSSSNAGDTARIAYEQIRLIDLSNSKETVIADQIQNCDGLGMFGFSGLYWSPSHRYFYYNDSREGQPDGGCGNYFSPPLYRLDTKTMDVIKLESGFLSPDGQKLVMWHKQEIIIWDLDQGEVGSVTPSESKLFNGRLWWSQKSDSVLFLQTEFECVLNFGKLYITRLDMSNLLQSQVAVVKSLDASVNPAPAAGLLTLLSYQPLVMKFDAARWQDESLYVAGDSTINYLESKDLPTCYLTIHRPVKLNPPYSKVIKRIGSFNFTVVTLDEKPSDFTHLFYSADQFIAGYDLRRGAPMIEVGAISSEWNGCKVLAEAVISTLQAPITP